MGAFETAALGWHDFYLAVASASAALLGLLFVGVSIGFGAVTAAERAEMRIRAGQAFANLSLVLVLSLLVLIPAQGADAIGIELGAVGAFNFLRVIRRVFEMFRGRHARRPTSELLRRMFWSVAGNLVLLVIAYELWREPSPDPNLLYWLLFVNFMFLMGAAEVAWSLLVRVSEEADGREEPKPAGLANAVATPVASVEPTGPATAAERPAPSRATEAGRGSTAPGTAREEA